MKINNTSISDKDPAYIVAEIGINHNGNLDKALSMIDAACQSNANAIKFQIFNSNEIFMNINKIKEMREFEFTLNQWLEIRHYAYLKKIDFIITPFGFTSLKLLECINPDAIKIGSGESYWFNFIKKILQHQKPVIISLGNKTTEEIKEIEKFLNVNVSKKDQIALLHCISKYPVEHGLNLCSINEYKKWGFCSGFSDHTDSIIAPSLAVCSGANIIEKHFDLEDKLGIDSNVSLTPNDFKQMVKYIRETEKHIKNYNYLIDNNINRGVYYNKCVKMGCSFNSDDISIKRPGNNININNFRGE